jgi:hypothetical protein
MMRVVSCAQVVFASSLAIMSCSTLFEKEARARAAFDWLELLDWRERARVHEAEALRSCSRPAGKHNIYSYLEAEALLTITVVNVRSHWPQLVSVSRLGQPTQRSRGERRK